MYFCFHENKSFCEQRYFSQCRDCATGWTTRVHLSVETMKEFSFCHRVQTGSGAYWASHPMNTRGLCPWGAKRPGRDCHSSPSSAEVTNARSYTSIHSYFMTWCLMKQEICLHSAVLCEAQGQLHALNNPRNNRCTTAVAPIAQSV
jgi:hypothetical protein